MSSKHFRSKDYNYNFNMKNGEFQRWGKTLEDDPVVSQHGPEILDLEVSTVCSGIPGSGPCKHCYKSNTPKGENMSFDTFKRIFDMMPAPLYSIAFGIGDLDANADLLQMFEYCRKNNVVPNLTVHGGGLTTEWSQSLAKYIGGIAVSLYSDKELCYNAVKQLSEAGIVQVNIHKLISEETFDECMALLDDAVTDERLVKHLKSVMFLTIKPKGKRNKMTVCKDVSKYKQLIDKALALNISIGFDSCSAPTFLMAVKDHPQFERIAGMVESCESNRMSGYVNVKGEWWHCSFTEEHPNWKGIDLMQVNDFMSDVWNAPEVVRFRERLTSQDNKHICGDCYLCPVYDLYDSKIGNVSVPCNTIGSKIIQLKEV